MDGTVRALLAIVGSILGLAVLSTLLSQRAQTVGVIGAASSGLANLITAAESPVTGGQANTGSSSSGNLGGIFNSILAGYN
jgi:hypothetical protein